jgi:hypothetical protein
MLRKASGAVVAVICWENGPNASDIAGYINTGVSGQPHFINLAKVG